MSLVFVTNDMSDGPDEYSRYQLLAVVAVSLLILLYSFLIAGDLFAGLGFLVFLYVLYLTHRFVRAHERIANALETRDEETDSER